jgi:glycosyltransferase involved in cell wall biosynthesis
MRRPRLVYVVTHPVTADVLLRGQLGFMREHGFDVTVIGSPGPELDRVRERERVETLGIPMLRHNDARQDAISLVNLTRALRRLRPDIVNAGTTKAGLLGMIAARAVSVPIRIYLLRGLRLETASGLMRQVLGVTERIASACAHDVTCVSPSLLRLSVDGGFIPARKACVIASGSSNGVDTERFRRTAELRQQGAALLAERGIGPHDPVVGFVGRLARDKGIHELLDAFEVVRRESPAAKLVLLGGDLANEVGEPELVARVRATPNVVTTPTIADLAPYYARIDVLAAPTYREGFPNVLVEAASAEVPVVAFRSTGVVDAVVDGETGVLVAQGDAAGLAEGVLGYLRSPERSRAHGRHARQRTEKLYERHAVWAAWLEAYRARLQRLGLPLPASC